MLQIPCPWCGPRSEDEFVYGGDASGARPPDPGVITDDDWLSYIYLRSNPRGKHVEWWFHQYGCGAWFSVLRDTVDHLIAPPPRLDANRKGFEP
jgi:heterotetrameric sarcosine oxidase delta subunit